MFARFLRPMRLGARAFVVLHLVVSKLQQSNFRAGRLAQPPLAASRSMSFPERIVPPGPSPGRANARSPPGLASDRVRNQTEAQAARKFSIRPHGTNRETASGSRSLLAGAWPPARSGERVEQIPGRQAAGTANTFRERLAQACQPPGRGGPASFVPLGILSGAAAAANSADDGPTPDRATDAPPPASRSPP